MQGLRVVHGVLTELNRSDLRPCLGNRGQGVGLMLRVAFHYLHQVGNQIGAALIGGLDVTPGGKDRLFLGLHAVVAAAGQPRDGQHPEQHKNDFPDGIVHASLL